MVRERKRAGRRRGEPGRRGRREEWKGGWCKGEGKGV
jgi:hypothetical protein